VEHGFVRPQDLPDYQPRPQVEEADQDEQVGMAARPPSVPILPDELDEVELALADQTAGKRKRKKQPPKMPDLTPADLGKLLDDMLASRAACWPALVELARPHYARNDPRMAAIMLRHIDEDLFPRRLLRAVRTRPGLLAQLWECVDDQPFHDLVE